VPGDWIFLLVLWSGSVLAIAVGARPVTQNQLTQWSVRFNVLVDDSTPSTLESQLRRARAIRCAAIVVGINVGALPMYMNVIDVERAGSFSNDLTAQAPFAAAALGSVIAELSLVHRPSGKRSAALVARRWTDYIDTMWIITIIACLPISLFVAFVATTGSNPHTSWLWVGPAASVLAILAMSLGVHVVVNRPANSLGEPHRRIDDALRADGAHHIVGAALALAGVATCYTLMAAINGPLGLLAGLLTYVVLGCWYGIARTERWNVDQARLQHA